jgi:predicted P-loop ATPase
MSFVLEGQNCDEILFDQEWPIWAEVVELILEGFYVTLTEQNADWVATEPLV